MTFQPPKVQPALASSELVACKSIVPLEQEISDELKLLFTNLHLFVRPLRYHTNSHSSFLAPKYSEVYLYLSYPSASPADLILAGESRARHSTTTDLHLSSIVITPRATVHFPRAQSSVL